MELKDLMELRSLEGNGFSPYEQMKLGMMQNKNHTSGVAVTGLVTGIVGTVAGVTAWIFAPLYANAKGNQAKEAAYAAKEIANTQYTAALQLMNQQNANTNATLDRLISTVATERAERIAGDVTISQNQTDTQSGSQASQLTAMQQAELAANQVATQQVMTGLMTGRYSENPQKVSLYSAPQPCSCPASGCGCGM